jgi:hypothetical protein
MIIFFVLFESTEQDDVLEELNNFQYLIKKPFNFNLLKSILLHIKKGKNLRDNTGRSSKFGSSFTEEGEEIRSFAKNKVSSKFLIRNLPITSNTSLNQSMNINPNDMRILVVDDNYFVRNTLVRQLIRRTRSVFECCSGEEVIRVY